MPLTAEQRQQIWTRANEQNHSYKRIAEDIGCSKGTVSRWARKDKAKVFPDDATDDTQPDRDDNSGDTADDKTTSTKEEKEGNNTSASDSTNSGVMIDDVNPVEQDTRKNKDSESDSTGDGFVAIDPNDKEQVKSIMQNTGISNPRKAQQFLWNCMTGNNKVNTEFAKIRIDDAELKE